MLMVLGLAPWVVGILTVLFLLICVMLMLTVLIQRPQGGGLAGAFGSGAGSGQTAFGAKTGDALTIFTIIMFLLFIGTAIGLNYAYRPSAPTDAIPAAGPTPGETPPQPGPTGEAPKDGTVPAPATTAPPAESTPTPAPSTNTAPASTPAPSPAPTTTPATTPPAETPK